DRGENRKLYGHEISSREILEAGVPTPIAGKRFVAMLNRQSSPARTAEPLSEVDFENRGLWRHPSIKRVMDELLLSAKWQKSQFTISLLTEKVMDALWLQARKQPFEERTPLR